MTNTKLSAEDLREAISLGVRMAEEEALWKLAMKAKQVAELDRRRPRLVVDNGVRCDPVTPETKKAPMSPNVKSENFTVRDTAHIDGGAYRWLELPDGSWRVEEWRGGKWVESGATFWEFLDNPPVGPAFAAELGIPPSDLRTTNSRL